MVRGGRHRDGDRRRCDRDPGNLLRHASRDPPPHRPGLLRRLGRLPDETYDHSRGRTHEPAATNPVGDPEKSWLLISAAEESQGAGRIRRRTRGDVRDRKSTRLNSSHSQISYAVFCLKKKRWYVYVCSVPTPSRYQHVHVLTI